MKFLIFSLFVFVASSFVNAQDIVLDATTNGTTVYTCGPIKFTDSGGEGGPSAVANYYGAGQDDTITICSNRPGYFIRVVLTQFYIDNNDYIRIYDGADVTGQYLGQFTADELKPNDTIKSSFTNGSGCLTFVFHSNTDAKEDQGWAGDVECFYPCQAFTVDPEFEVPLGMGTPVPPDELNPILICQGTTLGLNAEGVYPYSGPPSGSFVGFSPWPTPPYSQPSYVDSLYHQSDATSEFKWKIKGETPWGNPWDKTEMGSSASHKFDSAGVFYVWVEVTDNHHLQPEIDATKKCYNSNYLQQIVWVSPTPVFASSTNPNILTHAVNPQICNHTQNTLVGLVSPPSTTYLIPPTPPDPTAIPDVGLTSGEFYSSNIFNQQYPGEFVTSVSDIEDICIDMEHMALGDIEVTVTCPNGQTAVLIAYDPTDNTSNEYLGTPATDPLNGSAGTPGSYCFKMGVAQTMDDVALTTPPNTPIPNGSYLPFESFNSLIGCPANGIWSLTVQDYLDNDDGWVVTWSMNFDPITISPTAASTFTPGMKAISWVGTNPTADSFIDSVSVKNDTAWVTPHLPPGTVYPQFIKYRFRVQDTTLIPGTLNEVGCLYDTIIEFEIWEEAHPLFSYPNAPFCTNDAPGMPAFTAPNVGGTFTEPLTNPAGLSLNGSSGQIDPTASTPGTYDVVNTVTTSDGCIDRDTVQIVVKPVPVPNAGVDVYICPCDAVPLTGTYTIPAPGTGTTGTYAWTITPGTWNDNSGASVTVPGTETCNIASSYTVQLVVTEDGCSDSDEMLINTMTPNDATFSYPSLAYCQDVSSASPTAVVGIDSMWTSAPGLSIDLGLPVTPAPGGTYGNINPMASTSGTYTVFNMNQTEPLCPADIKSTTVEIRPLPLVNAGADVAICPGVIPNVLPTTNGTSSAWLPPPGGNGDPNISGAVNTGLSPITTQYTFGATLNGCSAIDFVLVTVLPDPIANAGVDKARCVDGPGQAIGTPNTTSGYSYSWSPCTNLSLCTGTSSAASGPTATPTVTTSYTVTVTSIDNCTATDQMVFTVNPLPTVDAGPDTTMCENYVMELIASGALNYVWTPSGTGSTDQHYSVSPPVGTHTYTVTGTDANGCSNTDQVEVTVLTAPVADINPSNVYGYPPMAVTFENNSTGSGTMNYDWNFANVGSNWFTVTNTDPQTSTYDNPGEYVVYLNAYNGFCGDLDTVRITVIPYQTVDFYTPNVFTPGGNDTINAGWNLVIMNPQNVGEYHVDIFNRWGEKMTALTSPVIPWDGTVNGNDAAEGVYFYKYRILGLDKVEYTGEGFFELFRHP